MIVDINQSQTYTVTTTTEPYLFKVLLGVGDIVKVKNLSFGEQDLYMKLLNSGMEYFIAPDENPIGADDQEVVVQLYASNTLIATGMENEESLTITGNGYVGYVYFEVSSYESTFSLNLEITLTKALQLTYRITKGTPLTAEEHDTNLNAILEKIANAGNTEEPILTYGTTQERPYKGKDGQFYFDFTLNKPIWFFSMYNAYVDATGAYV